MSQNGQTYTRRDVARLLKVEEKTLMLGERGAVIEHLERRHGKLDREVVNRWIKMERPRPRRSQEPAAEWIMARCWGRSTREESKRENKPGTGYTRCTAPIGLYFGRANQSYAPVALRAAVTPTAARAAGDDGQGTGLYGDACCCDDRRKSGIFGKNHGSS